MNTYDLLELIGDTPEEYVLDAGGLGQQTPAKKHMGKKILLIAAIVAAMSLLMGSAITRRLIALRTEKVTLQELPSNGDAQLSGPENTTAATETTTGDRRLYEGVRIQFEKLHNVFIAVPNCYPQQIPEGYTITLVSDDAPLQDRYIKYENDAGDTIDYHVTVDNAFGIDIYGVIRKTDVKINGLPGVLYEAVGNSWVLAWVDERQGAGYLLMATEMSAADLIAMAESTAEGEPLTPTSYGRTLQALEELGDFSPGYLPEGFEEYAVMGFPLMEGSWYSYVRKWYVNREENKLIYFEYETYKFVNPPAPEDEARAASALHISDYIRLKGEIPHEEIEVDGMFGLMTDEDITWADTKKDHVFHLYSEDVSPEELLKVAQSIREKP